MTRLHIENKKNAHLTDEAQELICFARICDIKSWEEVLNQYIELKEKIAPKKVLLLLEDIGQCNYTSMHASMGDGLYFDVSEYIEDGENEDASYENALPFEVQYHIEQLLKPENHVSIRDLHGKLIYSHQDLSTLIQINMHPEKILDECVEVKVLRNTTETQKFAAQLNGYFSCDLNPFESFSLIQFLDKNFGLEYIGLGASLLFFIKTPKFTASSLDELFKDLDKIYSFNQTMSTQLKEHFLVHDYIILPYVESLEVFVLD